MDLIKPKTVNFSELVRTSDTILSLNLQSELIESLNTNFNEEEQRWYISNLFMYINYHQTNDYPINLEDVYKILGFSNKANSLKTIRNNFTENEDYKVIVINRDDGKTIFIHTDENKKTETRGRKDDTLLIHTDEQKNEENRGGHNKEIIM